MKSLFALLLASAVTTFAPAADPITTASGLKYTVQQPGQGRLLQAGDYIVYHVRGLRPDGSVFADTHAAGREPEFFKNEPNWVSYFPPAFIEALARLPVGTRAALEVPLPAEPNKSLLTFLADNRLPREGVLRYEVEVLAIRAKSIAEVLWPIIEKEGMPAAVARFEQLRREEFPEVYTGSYQLDFLGRALLYHLGRADDALTVLKWNHELHPENPEVTASLAEWYFTAGQREPALAFYRQAFASNPNDQRLILARTLLKTLEGNPAAPTMGDRLKQRIRYADKAFGEPFSALPSQRAKVEADLDVFLADPKADPAEKTAVVRSLLGFANYFKWPGATALQAKFAQSPEPAAREAARLVAESNAKAAAKREAGALAKAEIVKQTVDVKFTAIDGREVDVAKLRGKVVLIDFWATWCGPCVAEIPNVVSVYEKYRDRGFEVIGITRDKVDKPESEILKFCESHGATWPQCFDTKLGDDSFAKKFGVVGIPAMFLVDQNGMIVSTEARGPKLEAEVKRLLKR